MPQRYDQIRICKGHPYFVWRDVQIAIVCYPTVGGSGVVATELAKALACRGHTVHLLSSEPPVRYTPCLPKLLFHQVEPPDYPVFRYRPYESALAGRLVRLVEDGVEVVHVHYAIPHAVSAYLAQKALERQGFHLPMITTLHGTDTVLVSQTPDLYPIIELALQNSTRITAVSHALAEESCERFHLPTPPEVIPNFVDTKAFSPKRYDAALRAAYAAPDEYLLVHASNFRPIKRVPWLIHLLAEVRAVGIPAKMLLIGDGPERMHCEQLAHQLGLNNAIHFVGSIQEVAPLLAIGDVFVLASAYESFGLAALEAMACGVPVVAPAVGGLPELIRDKAGRLFPPDDLTAARNAILHILQDLPAYRAAARQRALHYHTDKIVAHYERLYAQVRLMAS